MPRYVAGARTSAGSTTLPIISLYAAAGNGGTIREVGLFQTAAVAVSLELIRLTSTGTQGATITAAKFDPDSAANACLAKQTHSVAPGLGAVMHSVTLAAAIGAGVVWTFADTGLRTGVGTAVGIGVLVSTGTGAVMDAYIVWDE
jgi:hypothetical protein